MDCIQYTCSFTVRGSGSQSSLSSDRRRTHCSRGIASIAQAQGKVAIVGLASKYDKRNLMRALKPSLQRNRFAHGGYNHRSKRPNSLVSFQSTIDRR